MSIIQRFTEQCGKIAALSSHGERPDPASSRAQDAALASAEKLLCEITTDEEWDAMMSQAVSLRSLHLVKAFPRRSMRSEIISGREWTLLYRGGFFDLCVAIEDRNVRMKNNSLLVDLALRDPRWRPVLMRTAQCDAIPIRGLLRASDEVRIPSIDWFAPFFETSVRDIDPQTAENHLMNAALNASRQGQVEHLTMLVAAGVKINDAAVKLSPDPISQRLAELRSRHQMLEFTRRHGSLRDILATPLAPRADLIWGIER